MSSTHRTSAALDLHRRRPVEARVVTEARHEVCAFAAEHGAGSSLLGDVAVAVSEAVGNVVVHAYEGAGAREVHYSARVADGILEVHVCDDGLGIRDKPSPGLGLGLRIIAEVTDDFAVKPRSTGGLEILMRFVLARTG